EACLDIEYQLFLPDFLKNNGENLKKLIIYGEASDEYLGETIESIGKYCQHLRQLSIKYRNEMDQQLSQIFNNCNKLKSIGINFSHSGRFVYITTDGDRILTILKQTLPKN